MAQRLGNRSGLRGCVEMIFDTRHLLLPRYDLQQASAAVVPLMEAGGGIIIIIIIIITIIIIIVIFQKEIRQTAQGATGGSASCVVRDINFT